MSGTLFDKIRKKNETYHEISEEEDIMSSVNSTLDWKLEALRARVLADLEMLPTERRVEVIDSLEFTADMNFGKNLEFYRESTESNIQDIYSMIAQINERLGDR